MNCCSEEIVSVGANGDCLVLAGQPNVGKSVLFRRLTGRYVTVSNYPGTTVEVSRGETMVRDRAVTVVDAPGINSLQPSTDDERVTRRLLLGDSDQTVVQVGDAKNLARTLFLTLQLSELDVPLVLDLNMMDEARQRGITVDWRLLSDLLDVEVVQTIATRGEGMDLLKASLGQARVPALKTDYEGELESGVCAIAELLPEERVGKRGIAAMLLAGDVELERDLELSGETVERVGAIREETQAHYVRPLNQLITQRRWQTAGAVLSRVYRQDGRRNVSWGERMAEWCTHPVAGWAILLGVLFLVYKLVGEFGAGTLVNFVQGTVLNEWIIPPIKGLLDMVVPVPLVQEFLFGQYGLLSVGLVYGLGIVLPIVGTFFLAFGMIEDSGYLPRLAVMVNRAFRVIGLNGKAVLPMVLGLGCVTMATMTTRILGTRKERTIATLLLALSIPCSAQLGVVLAMVGRLSAGAVFVWAGVMLGVMLLVGWLAARVLAGERSDLIMEMPPLRLPQLDNILLKTLARVEWYLKEVIPIFLVATAGLFFLDKLGVLSYVERLGAPLVTGWLGLPQETAGIFLMGFLRRDYGAAGLFSLAIRGLLTPHQVLVSLVVITLFVPCVATVMMIVKEQGAKRAVAIVAFVFPFAFLIGGLVHRLYGS